ncbi:MAG: acetate kinase, partial [Clostridia bacterium]|nr:acetate kinase [Clostridia bacterium]
TSMGLTPLEGLPMGTRSGCLDPAIVSFISENEGLSATEVVNILNKKSGVLGITGISSDFRDVGAAADEGNERAQIALKMFNRSVEKYIGGYACIMGGLDAIVFTAGIGENNVQMRQEICDDIAFLGIKIDPEKNAHPGKDCIVSAPDSKVKVLVIPTNEELVIAMDTQALVCKK